MTLFGWQVTRLQVPLRRAGAKKMAAGKTSDRATLASLPAGRAGRVTGFAASLSPDQRAHLQAYGVIPGHEILALQHSPVTVVQVEHTELALESELAAKVFLEEIEPR